MSPFRIRFTFMSGTFGATLVLILALSTTKAPAPAEEARRTSDQPPVSDLIRAKRLQLVDNNGKTRIDIVGFIQFGPAFYLWDERGVVQIRIDTNTSGEPELEMYDKKGKTRARLWLPLGTPDLSMMDEKEVLRLSLGVEHPGPFLTMYDKKGNPVIWWQPPQK